MRDRGVGGLVFGELRRWGLRYGAVRGTDSATYRALGLIHEPNMEASLRGVALQLLSAQLRRAAPCKQNYVQTTEPSTSLSAAVPN